MSYTLPTAATADAETLARNAAEVATANAAFIADATVLINNAISNGLFQVQPLVVTNTDIPTVVAYLRAQGYTVLYPIVAQGPYWAPVVIPEVLPPGYVYPNQEFQQGPPRIQISWTAA